MNKMLSALTELTTPDTVAQGVLTGVPFWFCFILSFDGKTFLTSRSYDFMAAITNETNWAIISAAVVTISLVCWWTENYYLMVLQNCILMAWHGLIAMCVFLANPLGTGGGTYAVLAGAATIRAIHLALQHKHELNK